MVRSASNLKITGQSLENKTNTYIFQLIHVYFAFKTEGRPQERQSLQKLVLFCHMYIAKKDGFET